MTAQQRVPSVRAMRIVQFVAALNKREVAMFLLFLMMLLL